MKSSEPFALLRVHVSAVCLRVCVCVCVMVCLRACVSKMIRVAARIFLRFRDVFQGIAFTWPMPAGNVDMSTQCHGWIP